MKFNLLHYYEVLKHRIFAYLLVLIRCYEYCTKLNYFKHDHIMTSQLHKFFFINIPVGKTQFLSDLNEACNSPAIKFFGDVLRTCMPISR